MATRKPRTTNAAAKKNAFGAKVVGAVADVVVHYVANPENLGKLLAWVGEQRFPEKISDSLKRLQRLQRTSGKQDPLELIGAECDTVESLIETRSVELSDDAPIELWRAELDKIRRGVEFMEHAPIKDHGKIKELRQRSRKLFNSAFKAAVD